MADNKLSLLIDLSTKLYNSKLGQMHQNWKKKMDLMKANYGDLTAKIPSISNIFKRTMDSIPFAKYLNPVTLFLAAAGGAAYKLKGFLSDSVSSYKDVAQEESKLATIMRNNMGATADDIKDITDLMAAQEKVGVLDAGAQAAGVQILSAFTNEKKILEELIPVMNDLTTARYGANASGNQAYRVGRFLGQAFDGSAGALSRYGVKFTEAQEKILEFGNQAQRAAVITQAVQDSVGGMNRAMAETPEGKMKQLENRTQSLKERMGGVLVEIQTVTSGIRTRALSVFEGLMDKIDRHKESIIAFFSDLSDRVMGFFSGVYNRIQPLLAGIFGFFNENKDMLISVMDDIADAFLWALDIIIGALRPVIRFFAGWFTALKEGNPLVSTLTALLLSLVVAYKAYTAYLAITEGLTNLWTAAQWMLNAAMYANPIGIIVAAIVALIALVVTAIMKYDEWGAALLLFMGPLGIVISAFKSIYDHWESIKKAFKTGGMIEGLKRLGVVLLDALLKPLQQVLEAIASFDPTGLSQKALDHIKKFREVNNLVTPGETEKKEGTDKKKSRNLYSPEAVLGGTGSGTGTGDGPSGDKKLAGSVNKVTGDAKQVRNITINIDSLNKGGINMSRSESQGLTLDQIEDWFNEAMMRIMRNAELS